MKDKELKEQTKKIFKIRYRDTMTAYLLYESFKSVDEAENYIDLNLGESSTYEIVEIE